ncbi:protein FAM83H [Centroberyx affinis]|uniref:protein FAM83H n=1 Tax=Centroberyx affinis TaxID=166261 RepID=UPI003A5BCFF0
MAHRSQCSSAGDNPLDPNYLPPHYREEYRLAIDALVEENLEGYYQFLQREDVVDFLSAPEVQYIQCTVQVPQKSSHPEQRYLESGGDGSSDTYWPMHSDLDAPDLDLGWPQLHHFIGPTEVTTLVNPAEPDMPTIKEQARRLIKNAQQVVAIVMDMFTDVDILADVLNAAMRNVAVYILLDEQHAHHFINMVSNCRVNLESIQSLRVRTVSGITYHCRSGKSFKGQMMDRFLLTDCRAVLSGNYSFMWSFEKIHRCLAHLFLGQLVSTFDEEFRILYAQSQPLIIENVLASVEDFSHLPERQYISDRPPLYREPRKFLPNTSRPEEWARHSFDERMDMDWKKMPLNRHESMHRSLDQGPVDMYNKFPSQQLRMDPSYEQGHSRMPINIMENPAFKRHSYAEGVPGRHSSYQYLQQQGMPNFENQGRQFQRGQQPYPRTGPEADYSGYDKFRGHGYPPADQYSDPGLPQEFEPSDNFDPVLNYLSSTSNVDFDQGSEKLPVVEVPFGSSHPKRLSVGQPYACQTSPTHPNPPDQKQFLQAPNIDRKDPMVKQGLRNWRISSYLSAFDNAGDEDLPLQPPHETDPFEESSDPLQGMASGTDLSVPKFPNAREFKIPAVPRASQLPGYTKLTVPESSKKMPDDFVTMAAETKTTPTTLSESSSTTEGDKMEEVEPKEPKNTVARREESFRRKYNAAVQRSSRLRSSLIFSSQLEQHVSQDSTAPGQHDEETDKNEDDRTKLPFASKVLGQRRSIAREPFEWSRYGKSATFDNSTIETSKADDIDNKADVKDSSREKMLKDLIENNDIKESSKPAEVEPANFSPSMPRPEPSQVELSKTDQPVHPPKAFLDDPFYVDMSDPDKRLMFFKELAAKRKAAKAASAEKSTEKDPKMPPSELKNTTTVKKEESETFSEKNATAEDAGNKISTESSLHRDVNDKTNKEEGHPRNDSKPSHSSEEKQTRDSTDSEKIELKNSQASVSLPVSAGSAPSHSQSPEKPKLSNPAAKECSPCHPLTKTDTKSSSVPSPTDSLAQSTDKHESPTLDSTSKESSSLNPSSVELPPSSKSVTLESNQNLGPLQLESSDTSPPTPSESSAVSHPIGSESSSSHPSVPSSFSDHMSDSSSQNIPFVSGPSPSGSAPHSTPLEVVPSNISPADSSSTPTSSILSPKSDKTEPQESASPSPPESSQSANQTLQESSIIQTALPSDSTQVKHDSVTQSTSSGTLSTTDSSHAESNVSSDTCANDSEPNTASFQSTTKTHSEESCTLKPGSEKDLPKSKSNSVPQPVSVQSRVSPKDVKAEYNVSPSLSQSSSVSLPTESCLPVVSDLESPNSRPDQKEPNTPELTPAEPPPEHAPAETSSVLNPAVHSDCPPNASPSKPSASLKVALAQTTSPSELTLTGSSAPSPAAKISCSSPQSDSGASAVSPKAEKTETNKSPVLSPSETIKSPILSSSETSTSPVHGPSETSKSPVLGPSETSKSPVLSPSETSKSPVLGPSDTIKSPVLGPSETNKSPVLGPSETSKSPVLGPSETSKSPVLGPSETNKSPVLSSSETSKSPVLSPSETNKSPVHSPSETSKSPVLSPSETSKSPVLSPSETSKSPVLSPSETNKSPVLSPSETNKSSVHSPSETSSSPKLSSADSSKSPTPPSTESSSDHSLTDPTSKVTPLPTEPYPPYKTPTESKPVTSESHTSVKPAPAENNNMDNQCEVSKEPERPDSASEKKLGDAEATNKVNKTTPQESVCHGKPNDQAKDNNSSEMAEVTSDEVVPMSPQSKQSKASQSRYHSSTANVLSSSNLRDDTKLLLEQISANSQCRTEPTKEPAVTDDDKEDEAGKNANKEKGGTRLSRGQPKTTQEREKLLEKIQSMRKERKIYSRFEMAP